MFNTVVAEVVYSSILEVFHFPGGITFLAAGAWDLCVVLQIAAIELSRSSLLWLTVDMTMLQPICILLDQGIWISSYWSGLHAL